MMAPYGFATKLTVLRFVNVVVEPRLKQLGRVFEVREQIVFADVENADLDVLAEVGSVDEKAQSSPPDSSC